MRPRDEFSKQAAKPVDFERREWKDFEGDTEAQTDMMEDIGCWY